jgi:hypothetical protein
LGPLALAVALAVYMVHKGYSFSVEFDADGRVVIKGQPPK